MEKKIRTLRTVYPDIQVPPDQGRLLRGFFASGSGADSLLHNHGSAGRDIYRYPLVQYKIIEGMPAIVAAEAGIKEIYPLILERETLLLGQQTFPCGTVVQDITWETVGELNTLRRYRFCTPWFALNQENYRKYDALDQEGKRELLERILTGNILSLAKGLGIVVERRLQVETNLRECLVPFKHEVVTGFEGSFSVNFSIPGLLGLGKSVSRGFGAVCPEEK